MDQCGNYLIEDLDRLGRGGFGEVFKVNVYNLNGDYQTLYARKYFSPSPDNNDTPIREIADLRERFVVEIKTQCILNNLNHDAIAPVVLFNTDSDKPYFIMELAECSLFEFIKYGMNSNEKVDAVKQILSGVQVIHDNSYLHRDLKPANILKYPNNKYKISDFGLVKDLNLLRAEIKTRFNPNAIGSDGYRAPEISDNGLFSKQSDIYALGKIISDIYGTNAPTNIRSLIAKSTQFFPEERYDTVSDLLEAFCIAQTDIAEAS